MTEDEEIIPGPLRTPIDKEELEIAAYQAPSPHTLLFKRRVFEIESWCRKQGVLEKEELIAFVQAKLNINRKQAMEYVKEVLRDFGRMGKLYGQETNSKRYQA